MLKSSSGKAADLENIAVGEKFPGLANPDGASHAIAPPTYPFGGTFTLNTATLTPDASNNWFVDSSGELGGTHDTVSIDSTGIDVGLFIRSTSNPKPAAQLPQSLTVDQHLHWYNPLQATAANRWTDFATVKHKRELTNTAGVLNFVTTVNRLDDGGDAYTGNIAVNNIAASPATTPKSDSAPPAGGAAPAARTVTLSVDSLPAKLGAGQTVTWSIERADLGCTVAADPANPKRAILTVGTTAGKVTVRAADASGTNFDETVVTIK